MQVTANAEIVVYSGKSQGQADRDSRYKIDQTKELSKTESNPKSDISRYRRGRQESSTGNRAEVKNQESDVQTNQGTRQTRKTKNQKDVDTRISILLAYLELGSGYI